MLIEITPCLMFIEHFVNEQCRIELSSNKSRLAHPKSSTSMNMRVKIVHMPHHPQSSYVGPFLHVLWWSTKSLLKNRIIDLTQIESLPCIKIMSRVLICNTTRGALSVKCYLWVWWTITRMCDVTRMNFAKLMPFWSSLIRFFVMPIWLGALENTFPNIS